VQPLYFNLVIHCETFKILAEFGNERVQNDK